jgi:DNA-binding CsgD family transcriptional regulator/tetratricopeptide (TPR) repeat protein
MTDALIGRHAELQQAVEALKRSRAGEATTLVVRGEAGIGKSRFLDEVLAQAELLGHRVRDGRLGDLDRYVPFAAFVLALRPGLTDEPDPELWATAEALDQGLAGALPLPRIVDELERLLRGWATRDPVVLAVDDLHAADTDTLTVLSQLVRRLRDEPVTFVATVRSHLPDVGAELAATVERLGRDGLAVLIDLGPLDHDDVRGLARATLGATPDDHLVDALWDATRGSPFYVVEGLRSLQAAGGLVAEGDRCRLADDQAPSALSAQSTILYRLFELGPEARAVARAATCFRRVDLDDLPVLAPLAGLEPAEVEAAFDTLVAAHLLRQEAEGYEFAHPIVRHTLYEDLGPAERRRMHATVAAHLAGARAQGRPVAVTDLATHVAASASPGDEEAVAVLLEAAASVATTAPASAADWLDRALDLLPEADDRRGTVLADQAKARFLASQPAAAAEAAAAAVELLPPGHVRSRTAGLLVTSLTSLARFADAVEAADAILAASPEPLPRLHAERGSLLVHLDRFADAEAEAERALELAGDDDGARALAYRALAGVAHERGDVAGCARWYAEQAALAEHLGPAARLSALTTHAMHRVLQGYTADAPALLDEAAVLQRELGGATFQEALDVAGILTDWLTGAWDDALDRLRWLGLAPTGGEGWVDLARAAACAIHAERGDAGAARDLAAELAEPRLAPGTAAWARAKAHRLLGEHDLAAAELEGAWEANQRSGRLADTPSLLGERVAVAHDQGDPDGADRWAETLAAALPDDPAPLAAIIRDRCLGGEERVLASVDQAEAHNLVLEAALGRLELGRLGLDPTLHLKAAYETARELGAEGLRRRVAKVMKDHGIEPPRARRVAEGELTDTEVRLAHLVHDGLTNREIANVLIVSPKTVEVYLSRLFAKTGCESRVDLAVAVSEGRIG